MTPFNTWIRGPPYIYPNFSGFCRRAKRLSETTEALNLRRIPGRFATLLYMTKKYKKNIFQCKSRCVNQHDCLSMHTHIFDLHLSRMQMSRLSSEFPVVTRNPASLGPGDVHRTSWGPAASKQLPSCQMLTHAPKWAKKAASDFRCPKDHRNSTCSDPKTGETNIGVTWCLRFFAILCVKISADHARQWFLEWGNFDLIGAAYISTWQFCQPLCPFWDGEKVTPSKVNRDLQRLGMKRSRIETTGRWIANEMCNSLSQTHTSTW